MREGEGERLLGHVPGGLDVARPPQRCRHRDILEAVDQLCPGVRAAGPRSLHHRVQSVHLATHLYEEGAACSTSGYLRPLVDHRRSGEAGGGGARLGQAQVTGLTLSKMSSAARLCRHFSSTCWPRPRQAAVGFVSTSISQPTSPPTITPPANE